MTREERMIKRSKENAVIEGKIAAITADREIIGYVTEMPLRKENGQRGRATESILALAANRYNCNYEVAQLGIDRIRHLQKPVGQ
jgi:hypothetical protein